MIATERQFGKVCKQRGFARLAPRYYARCYGEGLYQVIYTGSKVYSSGSAIAENPELANRKHYSVNVIIRSLYGHYEEEWFTPAPEHAGISPRVLVGYNEKPYYFRDTQYDYELMENGGFDVLDEIDTHQKLAELELRIKGQAHGLRSFGAPTTETYLIIGDTYEAQANVAHYITHNAQAMVSVYGPHRDEGVDYIGIPLIQRWIMIMENHLYLWDALKKKRNDQVYQYLADNYTRNMQVIEKHGAPIHPNFRMAKIPETFFE